jgi:uncharacterized delta-60 repeat protein
MKMNLVRTLNCPILPIRHVATIFVCASIVALSAQMSFNPANAQSGCTPASTAPGSLDTCFGNNGLVTTVVSPTNWAVDIAVQSDGKVVVASTGRHPSGSGSDFYAVRYDADSNLDPTFGSNGIARVSFTSAADAEHIRELAIQTDGKILLAGSANIKRNTYGFAVARLNTDGSLDDGTTSDSTPGDSFGIGGKALFGFSSGGAIGEAIAIQSDGKIVVAGNQGTSMAVARLNSSGSLDGGFGSGGKLTVSGGKNTTLDARDVVIQVVNGEERIVAGGFRQPNTGTRDFAVIRLLPNGALDLSFGSGGKVYTDFFGYGDTIEGLAISGTGIIAGGIAIQDGTNDGMDFGLVKYTENGTLDPTFGVGGKVTTDVPGLGLGDYINALAVQPDGRIVAVGTSSVLTDTGDFPVARYNADGTLDLTFGPNQSGYLATDFNGGRDDATGGVALQADGKIVVAGLADSSSYVALARYMP